ncbi:endolytic transglycosylase MltG [Scatolibacter rhodanostii]|uniref:endolytic transglycosylase MltG n=1 Tax=Scatolibacter rhodanostii TaxID=2014781 RepID=UPI000C080F30|nr:endolytic transglycosylase MltG [Scatolibacter rhodanostii]
MNENQGNTGPNSGRYLENAPKRPTTENFKLNLTDEQMATGPMRAIHSSDNGPMPIQQSYGRQHYSEAEKKQEKKAHKKRNKIKAGKNKRVFSFVWLIMVILLSLSLGGYLSDGAYDFLAKNRQQENFVDIEIPENVTVDQLATLLQEKGAIDEEEFFQLYFKITASDDLEYVRAGTHKLKTNMDYQEIIDNLISGEEAAVATITIVEGSNVTDIANLLEENNVCSAQDFLDEVKLAKYQSDTYPEIRKINNLADRYYLLEGYLYPDTYFLYEKSDPSDVVQKLLGNYSEKIKFLNSKIEESGYTLDEVMRLASIIQREAANVDDMYKVSAVLHNRLNFGADYDIYTLDCDSTTFYPYHTKADAPEGYTSSYNTYEVQGLPAGPICNPGTDAIKAALMPNEEYGSYLYFCHSAEGEAFYAQTAEEHQVNLELAGLL